MLATTAPHAQRTPDFLVVGHVTRDLVGDDVRAGGTATYAAAVARRFGLETAILTSAGDDYVPPPELDGVAVYRLPAEHTTLFRHVWRDGVRDQFVLQRAATLTGASVPDVLLAAPVVLFGPVCGEVAAEMPSAFPAALRGATLQGWLRRLGPDGHVEPLDAASWASDGLLGRVEAAMLSDEDITAQDAPGVLRTWARRVPVLAVTGGKAGARIAIGGRWGRIAAMPAHEVDGTGAGDTFAAAFLIRYHETADPDTAARFASAAASLVVEARGITGAPTRAQVDARLAAAPAVRLHLEAV